MELTTDDVIAIQQLLALYGHLVDGKDWQRFEEIFSEDAIFDATDFGARRTESLDELVAWFSGLDHPPAHHTSNIHVTESSGGARAHSKLFGPDHKGRIVSGDYVDDLVRTDTGWRIRCRVATMRAPQPTH